MALSSTFQDARCLKTLALSYNGLGATALAQALSSLPTHCLLDLELSTVAASKIVTQASWTLVSYLIQKDCAWGT